MSPHRRAALALGAVMAVACAAVPVPRRSVYHPSDADLSVTRIAHSSVIVAMGGTRVVVDPWFHSGLLVRQDEPLGLTPDDLPPLQAVLLTHDHSDHLDERALRGLAGTVPQVVARPELHDRLAALGFRQVTDLGWWDTTRIGTIDLTAVPARHSVTENGYVLEAGGVSLYAAGDTRDFPELVDIATRFPHLDVALLPVGGERVLGIRRQMGPADAARAAALLDPRRIIPIGYGEASAPPLWWYTRRPTERFIEQCTERGIDRARILVLEPGESWHYYR